MAHGRCRHDWTIASHVLCLFANAHRDTQRKRLPWQPDQFNPYASRRRHRGSGIPINRDTMPILAKAFPKRKTPWPMD